MLTIAPAFDYRQATIWLNRTLLTFAPSFCKRKVRGYSRSLLDRWSSWDKWLSHADRKTGLDSIRRHALTDSCRRQVSFPLAAFGQHQRKFIAAVSRRRVDRTAAISQHHTHALNGAAPRQMAVLVVSFSRSVEIE